MTRLPLLILGFVIAAAIGAGIVGVEPERATAGRGYGGGGGYGGYKPCRAACQARRCKRTCNKARRICAICVKRDRREAIVECRRGRAEQLAACGGDAACAKAAARTCKSTALAGAKARAATCQQSTGACRTCCGGAGGYSSGGCAAVFSGTSGYGGGGYGGPACSGLGTRVRTASCSACDDTFRARQVACASAERSGADVDACLAGAEAQLEQCLAGCAGAP